jgi:hypothetical protein
VETNSIYDRIGGEYASRRRPDPHWAAPIEAALAGLETVVEALRPAAVGVLPVPAACTDGFFGAYWQRPHAYLDPTVRHAISALALLDEDVVLAAMRRLRSDLESGRWHERYSELLALNEIDLGYRLVVAERQRIEWPE